MNKSKQELPTLSILTQINRVVVALMSADNTAFAALRDAIKDALLRPEIKNSHSAVTVGEKFIELLDNRQISKKSKEAVFRPITKAAIAKNNTEKARKAGSATKKPSGKDKALLCWNTWKKDPGEYKNKTAFCKYLVNEKYCNTDKTASSWVEEFRNSSPCTLLEKILPSKKR